VLGSRPSERVVLNFHVLDAAGTIVAGTAISATTVLQAVGILGGSGILPMAAPRGEHEVMESWDDVVASLTAAYGLKAWGTRLGHGSFLTVEFGEPERDGKHGSYHLAIEMAPWRLEDADAMLVGAEDDNRAEVEEKVKVLDGRALTGFEVEYPSLSARLEFEGGLVLMAFPESRTDEHWKMFRPDSMVVTAGPDSSLWVEPANGPVDAAYPARR